MSLKDLIIGSGETARKAVDSQPKKKTNYIRLKDGQSVRGFLLTTEIIAFFQHGDFANKIHSHVCTNPRHESGKQCLSCEYNVPRSKVWLVPFYDIDAGEIRVFEAKKKYMNGIYSFIDQYEEESTTTPVVLTRSGSDAQSTTYTLMPLRVKPAEKDLFAVPNVTIDDSFYGDVLQPLSEEYHKQLLRITSSQEEEFEEETEVDLLDSLQSDLFKKNMF
jgi:hypothetical protein